MDFTTKDSGERKVFESGMARDVETGKLRYDLIPTSMLARLAGLYTRGAEKYTPNNWQKANSQEEYDRFVSSAFRHFEQWRAGERDEDHAIAVVWNLFCYEWHMEKEPDTGHAGCDDPTCCPPTDVSSESFDDWKARMEAEGKEVVGAHEKPILSRYLGLAQKAAQEPTLLDLMGARAVASPDLWKGACLSCGRALPECGEKPCSIRQMSESAAEVVDRPAGTPLASLELPPRVHNTLVSHGAETVEDALSLYKNEPEKLLTTPGFGRKSMLCLKEHLSGMLRTSL